MFLLNSLCVDSDERLTLDLVLFIKFGLFSGKYIFLV